MNPPEFASYWARELGSRDDSLQRLSGGINNQVFRCGSHDRYWVIKGYPTHQLGHRDRMQAEVEFLRYANQVAPKFVPKLIMVDTDRRCVVLEDIDGLTYPEGVAPSFDDVQAAGEFFGKLNADLCLARQMIHLDAAEGFLSLRQHMANVRQRLCAMGTDHLPAQFKSKAAELLAKLQRQADRVETDLESTISAGLVEDQLDPQLRCVSPSDFGFHNAIRTDQGVTFVDFEFAGWDDPAKASADFILQPRVPAANVLVTGLKMPSCEKLLEQNARFNSLKPILTLKWTCIILAILNSERLAKILEFSPEQSNDHLIKDRITSASLFVSEHSNELSR